MADPQSRERQYIARLNVFEQAAFWSFTFTSPFGSGPDGSPREGATPEKLEIVPMRANTPHPKSTCQMCS
jgi:hypothetical protein